MNDKYQFSSISIKQYIFKSHCWNIIEQFKSAEESQGRISAPSLKKKN